MLKLAATAALALALTGPCLAPVAARAAEPESRQAAIAALQAQPDLTNDAVKGRSSMAWGDVFIAANLMEKSEADRSTVISRFNLATAYERTGRLDDAARLYRGLVRDGGYTEAVLDSSYQRPDLRSQGVNVADESAARLAVLDRLATRRQASVAQPFSAGEAATNVAAAEGRSGERISNDRAIALDDAARAARARAGVVTP